MFGCWERDHGRCFPRGIFRRHRRERVEAAVGAGAPGGEFRSRAGCSAAGALGSHRRLRRDLEGAPLHGAVCAAATLLSRLQKLQALY